MVDSQANVRQDGYKHSETLVLDVVCFTLSLALSTTLWIV